MKNLMSGSVGPVGLALLLALASFEIGRRTSVADEPAPADSASRDRPGDSSDADPADVQPPKPEYASVKIAGVPHVRQKLDFCGEACAEMVLAQLGHAIVQDDVFDQSGLDPELGRGCYTKDLQRSLVRIGFDVGTVWYSVLAARADRDLEQLFAAMHRELVAGIPSIVCMHYDDREETTEHFRLVLGYDSEQDEVLYHEPAVARGAYRRMPRTQFLELWPLKYDPDRWTVIRLRLRPGTIRDVHSTAKFTRADYAQEVIRAKRKASDDFTAVVEPPFVVLGDESPAMVRQRATGTIRWAVNRLKSSYFQESPDEILAIWLFKDKASYDKHNDELFGTRPHTPFGYYSHEQKALIMNIDTGGGTLVHEIVHPFIAANFPECPAWFNEGLASLYEQCGDHRGQIWGYTNWRLEGLQKVIAPELFRDEEDGPAAGPGEGSDEAPDGADAAGTAAESAAAAEPEVPAPELPSFKTLCQTSTRAFYGYDPGTNYSQARYLCYYLQQAGLLQKYYREFREHVGEDPSGYETLKSVLGIEDEAGMERFQETWEAWVLKLKYP